MQYFSSATTLGAPSKPVEIKITVWAADGSSSAYSANSASGNQFIHDGAASMGGSVGNDSTTQLHTLSSKWPAGTKFAFEATIYNTTGGAANFALWDFTSAAIVSSSQVNISTSTASVVRSGQFTLTDGHVLGVTGWNGGSGNATIIDAAIIVFPN